MNHRPVGRGLCCQRDFVACAWDVEWSYKTYKTLAVYSVYAVHRFDVFVQGQLPVITNSQRALQSGHTGAQRTAAIRLPVAVGVHFHWVRVDWQIAARGKPQRAQLPCCALGASRSWPKWTTSASTTKTSVAG